MAVREDIVAYCRDQIGCEYDTTPSGGVEHESYNCSYLTYCAYRSAGLRIPTWQGHQNGEGSQSDWVRWNGNWTDDPDQLLPGDLVFFGSSPYYTTHVGISLGGYRMIDSVPDGGVQERCLYDSFVGGGWPLDWYPKEHVDDDDTMEEPIPMDCIISIPERNTCIAMVGGHIHDLTEPDNITVLDTVWKAGHNGEIMPRVQLSPDWYARLAQVLKAGLPAHLNDLNDKFTPRSLG